MKLVNPILILIIAYLLDVHAGRAGTLDNFERGRSDYSDGIANGPVWVFCRVRMNPTDSGHCSDRPMAQASVIRIGIYPLT